MRLFFTGGGTGGHLYPALAIARAVVRLDASVTPVFIGAQRGIERELLPATEFAHLLLDLHPLYRGRPWENWKTLRGLAGAFGRIDALAREGGGRDRPRLVVGTGGYAAGATLGWAAARRVPLVIQEQNGFPGLTVRLFSRFARAMYLGFPEAAMHLPARARARCIDTGNPITPPPAVRPDRSAARATWGIPGAPENRVLLVFGGSQGSAALNAVVDAWVAAGVPEGLYVIWATGRSHFDRHRARESERVRVRAYLQPIADAYAATDLALTRAGAMTTAELAAWGIPPILVPLPTAAADHQTVNARMLAQSGAAQWIPQRELTVARLDGAIRALVADHAALDALAKAISQRARPQAADVIAKQVLSLVG